MSSIAAPEISTDTAAVPDSKPIGAVPGSDWIGMLLAIQDLYMEAGDCDRAADLLNTITAAAALD